MKTTSEIKRHLVALVGIEENLSSQIYQELNANPSAGKGRYLRTSYSRSISRLNLLRELLKWLED